jgi:uncharacterized Zn finger protein (UPF0148 family)
MNNPVCPTCGQSFFSEDFCPVHGERLVIPKKSSSSELILDENPLHPHEPFGNSSDEASVETNKEPNSKLSDFMSRMKLRHIKKDESISAVRTESDVTLLPDDLLEMGWKIVGPVSSVGGNDTWPVELETNKGTETGIYRRFRTGSLTQPSTYERIMDVSSPFMPKIKAHGTVDMGGARTDFEVVSNLQKGTILTKWFAESKPSEERAQYLLRPLSRLLSELRNEGLQPIVLEDSMILLADDGQLTLISAGTIAESQTDDESIVQYRPEFIRSALLPQNCTAPEVVQQCVLSCNAGVFSVGQLLAQAVWGQAMTHNELQTGAVPFNTLVDKRLSNILKGCLWPKSKGRWTHIELDQATDSTLDICPAVNAWASLVPGASSTAFSFAGESYWRLEDLLHIAVQPQNWDEAIIQIEDILKWAQSTSWAGQSKMLLEALASGKSTDFVLIKLARVVNPGAPINWRELDLTDTEAQKSLAALAQRVLKGSTDEIPTMQALFEKDLRGAFTLINSQQPTK